MSSGPQGHGGFGPGYPGCNGPTGSNQPSTDLFERSMPASCSVLNPPWQWDGGVSTLFRPEVFSLVMEIGVYWEGI